LVLHAWWLTFCLAFRQKSHFLLSLMIIDRYVK
jgi:hypothetical protein